MDIKSFFKLLNRYKWILILVPLISAVATYFLVKQLPKTYNSEALIATGIVDPSKQVAGAPQMDYFKMTQEFNNIIEKMKMRKIMSILSYRLVLHDLENPAEAFKPYSEKVDSLTVAQRQQVIKLFRHNLDAKIPLSLADNKAEFKLYDIVSSMGYGETAINKGLDINHPDNSDFIKVTFTSSNPLLSAYVVNTLTNDFIRNYGIDVNFNQGQSNELLDSVLKVKEGDMNAKNLALKDFKMKNGVLNLDKQSQLVYAQITAAEDRKGQVLSNIQANQNAIAQIESRLRSDDPNLGKNVSRDNSAYVNIKNQLEIANKRYVDGNFKPEDKRRIDSLTNIQVAISSNNSDKYVVDPQVSRQALLQQKYQLETTVAQLSGSVKSLNGELATANSKYNAMVPFDANIQNYQRDADLATKDYLEALNRINTTQTQQNMGLKLQVAQMGMPGFPDKSKTLIYTALSGIATLAVCFAVLLALFVTDGSVNTSHQLASVTKSKVIGSLNFIPDEDKTIKTIWENTSTNNHYSIHKELLRSLRFEISDLLAENDNRILGITSLVGGEGKTFVAANLAYAYAMTGKKILLIGGEQASPVLSDSKQLTRSQNFETFLINREIKVEDLITKLSKVDHQKSLLEIQNERNLKSGFDVLKKQFDIIIIDIESLTDINIAKEWLSFTEKSIAVFAAGRSLTDGDKDMVQLLKKQPGFIGWVINKVRLSEIQD
ncbi:Chromosome partitioning ATPase, Mrp family, contains Fe-S cluster [Pedobacter westerhofensis]|uniref:Chromosome partitioning ATPase, Mrp family, contains Fe-S cluster n=1 Tax=Pedobacter westerhofensis TaxID=425512 RepID=A0A521E6A2_9SPHI|nr:lipopolysaccharide biosynthesis protein [Pedobacter westerhofensis]SMO79478.1 Chromosome partitioning ATPase, Mrp family, contains Fe-S cluster [Pedobacter westerhofensis]